MPYIECKHCEKKIHNTRLLKDMSLCLEKNKIYGFIGHNGCGKTMLFKLLTGMISASEGEVLVNGERVDPAAPYPQKLGVMIENNGLWPYLSAYDNLAVLASIRKEMKKQDIQNVLHRVGLDNTGKKVFSKFSLGMKQRLMLAQAIMERPELLVLDEPTNALDKDGIRLFKQIILEEKERGATVLIASHSLEDFTNFCDGVVYMEQGEITKTEMGESHA